MSRLVLVDTSVFIAFFRGYDSGSFEACLAENRILLSSIVELELLQGMRREEAKRLRFVLGGLRRISLDDQVCEQAQAILEKTRDKGLRIGVPDLLLAAQSRLHEASIQSFDRVFRRLESLGLIEVEGRQ